MPDMHRLKTRNAAIVTLGLALALGTMAGIATAGPAERDTAVAAANSIGRGERLILVVLASTANETDAKQAAAELSGHAVGSVYVDEAKNYQVLGAYTRSREKFVDIPCPKLDNPRGGMALVDGVWADLASICVEDQEKATFFLSARLAYQPGKTAISDGWLVLSGFRTLDGAEAFVTAVEFEKSLEPEVYRVLKTGSTYIGLGQEANPDGSGPLQNPRAAHLVEEDQIG